MGRTPMLPFHHHDHERIWNRGGTLLAGRGGGKLRRRQVEAMRRGIQGQRLRALHRLGILGDLEFELGEATIVLPRKESYSAFVKLCAEEKNNGILEGIGGIVCLRALYF